MITDHIVSVKWATAINEFDIKKPEDLNTLAEFRSWYTKASTISEVPQPYRGWVENGLPAKHQHADKSVDADIEKNNPNRDSRGRFDFGPGGGAGGSGGAGGAGEAEGGAGDSGGAGDGVGDAEDITSDELGRDYGQFRETKLAQKLRVESSGPEARGDAVLEDIAKRQGFDGEADLVDQAEFDKIVANGGTVTYRGITDYHNGPGPDATYIQGDSAITNEFAEGSYFGGMGMYGSGTYTSTEIGIANHYAFDEGSSGAVVTMVVKPNARIATPAQYAAVRQTVKEGKGGFMGADNEGRVLAAQGFDGYKPLVKNVDAPGTSFIIVLNRKALAVLKK